MQITEKLDMAIAEDECTKHNYERGYVVPGREKNMIYLSNKAFADMVEDMKTNHPFAYNQFRLADGGEMKPKGKTPPKMASFASSSRMIYSLSKDIPGFAFEEKLPTGIGGAANLDGYLEQEKRHIYVEAKCHEPYSHTGSELISDKYEAVYQYLASVMGDAFSCEIKKMVIKGKPEKDNVKLRVSFSCKDNLILNFDIKQMICHMLGIAVRYLTHPNDKEILFLYLLYNPSHLKLENREEIMEIYNATCWAADNYDMENMFGHIVDYLVTKENFAADSRYVAGLKSSFKFKLCDQNDYHSYF